MDKRFWTMFSLLALTSLCLIYIGFQFYHLNYINDAQLGYAGAILGGSMTLIGVWWTIDKQEKQRIYDLSVQYKPYLQTIGKIILREDEIYGSFVLLNSKEYLMQLHLSIENIGRGEGIIKSINVIYPKNLKSILNINTKIENTIIHPTKQTDLTIDIKSKNNSQPFKIKEKTSYFIEIIYTDLFENYKYKHYIEISIEHKKYSSSSNPSKNEIFKVLEMKIQ